MYKHILLITSILLSSSAIADWEGGYGGYGGGGGHHHHHAHHGHGYGRPHFRGEYYPPAYYVAPPPPVVYYPAPVIQAPTYYAPAPVRVYQEPAPVYSGGYHRVNPVGLVGGALGSAFGYQAGHGDPLAAGLGAVAGSYLGNNLR